MAKDPAFLFYPGDYLKDTQCLSEKAQVAYDRIMCEHMRNISEDMNKITVSKERVNFFTKRLTADEKSEIDHVLTRIGEDYQIDWVAESICKRRVYGNSRRENRTKKPKNISSSYVPHMENEIENVNGIEDINYIEAENKFIIPKMCLVWYKKFPTYTADKFSDYEGMGKILKFISGQAKVKNISEPETQEKILATLQQVANCVNEDNFWVNKPIKSIANNIQEFYNKIKNPTNGAGNSSKSKANGHNYKTGGAEIFADRLKEKLANLKPE